uniref:Uncharacterized protein n=1 Tax=Timema shepardi TaxID=629360 RepID=A0A7R9AWJ2_TIMSH|nr:unnamed protein product [Timema shepardi]
MLKLFTWFSVAPVSADKIVLLRQKETSKLDCYCTADLEAVGLLELARGVNSFERTTSPQVLFLSSRAWQRGGGQANLGLNSGKCYIRGSEGGGEAKLMTLFRTTGRNPHRPTHPPLNPRSCVDKDVIEEWPDERVSPLSSRRMTPKNFAQENTRVVLLVIGCKYCDDALAVVEGRLLIDHIGRSLCEFRLSFHLPRVAQSDQLTWFYIRRSWRGADASLASADELCAHVLGYRRPRLRVLFEFLYHKGGASSQSVRFLETRRRTGFTEPHRIFPVERYPCFGMQVATWSKPHRRGRIVKSIAPHSCGAVRCGLCDHLPPEINVRELPNSISFTAVSRVTL